MIGRLRGILLEVGDEEVLIEVGGVGYIVRCGARALAEMPGLGSELIVFIDSQTREDGTRLFGFLHRDERKAFVTLLGVQGVGPKAALAVLDVLTPAELARALVHEDRTAIERANGVGPRLAQRIVLELRPKAAALSEDFAPLGASIGGGAGFGLGIKAYPMTASHRAEAITALTGLGVAEAPARTAVDQVLKSDGTDIALPELIKAALKALNRPGGA